MEYGGYVIKGDGTFGYRSIWQDGRGSVPLGLRGVFTTDKEAMKAIDQEKTKREKNVKDVSE